MEQKPKDSKQRPNTQALRVVRAGKKTIRTKRQKPLSKSARIRRTVFGILGKTLLSLLLVLTITGCIVGTAMTIYVMQYVNSAPQINLPDLKLNYTSVIYGLDEQGNDKEIQRLHREENRVWVDYKDIPDVVKAAFVLAEDKRFFEHEGVDFIRTASAFLTLAKNMLHIGPAETQSGGSTITQQLIKNINGDVNDRSYANKIKEIMQAMNLERHYSKQQILEMYLNYVAIGPNINGVQAASQYYFGKDISQVNANEAVALAISVKNPNKLNPKYRVDHANDPDDKYVKQWDDRHYFVLGQLLHNGKLEKGGIDGSITQAQYDEYIDTPPAVVKQGGTGGAQASSSGGYSYYVDAVLESVIADLMEKYNYTYDQADNLINTAGWKIYTPMEISTQNTLEEMFVNPDTFDHTNGGAPIKDSLVPDAAMVLIDPQTGYVRALVGGRGEKTVARGFNLATNAVRAFGSTIKPLSVYAPAFEENLINWSMILVDEPKLYVDREHGGAPVSAPAQRGWPPGVPLPEGEHFANWPYNYDKSTDGPMTVIDALKVSKNTIPVEIYDTMNQTDPMTTYNYLTKNFHFPNLIQDASQVGPDAFVLGSAGTTLLDLTAAYQIFANGGYYTEPMLYTQVLDSEGKVMLDNTNPRRTRVLAPDTAYIMNRALAQVVNGPRGVGGSPSGAAARLDSGMEVIGKTGTSMDRRDLLFMGATTYYVAGIRYGHRDNSVIANAVSNSQIGVWKRVMTEILKDKPVTKFNLPSEGVIEAQYCLDTGFVAGPDCTKTGTGYYKVGNVPPEAPSSGESAESAAGEESAEGDLSSAEPPPYTLQE